MEDRDWDGRNMNRPRPTREELEAMSLKELEDVLYDEYGWQIYTAIVPLEDDDRERVIRCIVEFLPCNELLSPDKTYPRSGYNY